MRDLILRSQLLILCLLHDRIHEEAARIALHLRVWQLGVANLDDDVTKLLGCRILDMLGSQGCTDIAVIQIRHKAPGKSIDDMGNQILILPLVLEPALAIAVVAILVIEHHYPARSNLHGFHLIYNILRFHAIGSDVLHGTRSHFARDNAQVLGTMIAMLHGVSHHIVEHLATAATQEHELRIQQGIIMLSSSQFAFAKHRAALRNALKGYTRLNVKAFEKIKHGGILFTFSCSQVVTKENFRNAVFTAAAISGRNVRILHQLHQPADHPINIYHPEGEYLKGLVLYVE